MESPMVTCDDVNALVAMCSISQEEAITSLRQCSSSLFVLLYQRLFNCAIKDIDSSPYTAKQKKWNVRCVLNELRDKRGIDVEGIDAEEIVQLNEEHISRLIMLFLNIAHRMKLQGGGAAAVSRLPTAALQPVLAELPNESAEEGMWYAPVGALAEGGLLQHHHQHAHPQPGHLKAAAAQLDEERRRHQTHPHPHPEHQHEHHHTHYNSRAMEARTRQEEPLIARGVFALGSEGESEDGGNEVKDDGCSDGSYGNLEEEEIPTTQMVKAWNAEVIPPERMGHAMVSSAGFVDARERLSLLDARLAEAARERESRRRRGKQRPVDFRAATRGGTRRKGGAVLPRSLLPDTVSRDEAHRKEPKRMIDYKLRNEKIEMLRCLRFIDDLQKEVRRNMVQRHSDATRQLREDMRHALQRDRQEKMEHQRLIKEEDQKYRNAYAAIMTAACNDRRIAKDLMLERTRQLAEYQSLSLRESRRMCHYMKQESKERMRHDLLHYVSTITGWQSHFVS